VLVTDAEMRKAAQSLWFENAIAADLSGAAAIAALQSGAFVPDPQSHVCAIVCGAGNDGLI
jgi:threonine dehydratase